MTEVLSGLIAGCIFLAVFIILTLCESETNVLRVINFGKGIRVFCYYPWMYFPICVCSSMILNLKLLVIVGIPVGISDPFFFFFFCFFI